MSDPNKIVIPLGAAYTANIAGKERSPKSGDTVERKKSLIHDAIQTGKEVKMSHDHKLPWQYDTHGKLYSTQTEQLRFKIDYLEKTASSLQLSDFDGDKDEYIAKKMGLYVNLYSLLPEYELLQAESEFKNNLHNWILGEGKLGEYNKCWWIKDEVEIAFSKYSIKELDKYLKSQKLPDTETYLLGGLEEEDTFKEYKKKRLELTQKLIKMHPQLTQGMIENESDLKFKGMVFLQYLKRKIPKTDEEAYLWYKYIIRKQPLDFNYLTEPYYVGHILNNPRNYMTQEEFDLLYKNDFESTIQRIKETAKAINEDPAKIEEEVRDQLNSTPYRLKNEAMKRTEREYIAFAKNERLRQIAEKQNQRRLSTMRDFYLTTKPNEVEKESDDFPEVGQLFEEPNEDENDEYDESTEVEDDNEEEEETENEEEETKDDDSERESDTTNSQSTTPIKSTQITPKTPSLNLDTPPPIYSSQISPISYDADLLQTSYAPEPLMLTSPEPIPTPSIFKQKATSSPKTKENIPQEQLQSEIREFISSPKVSDTKKQELTKVIDKLSTKKMTPKQRNEMMQKIKEKLTELKEQSNQTYKSLEIVNTLPSITSSPQTPQITPLRSKNAANKESIAQIPSSPSDLLQTPSTKNLLTTQTPNTTPLSKTKQFTPLQKSFRNSPQLKAEIKQFIASPDVSGVKKTEMISYLQDLDAKYRHKKKMSSKETTQMLKSLEKKLSKLKEQQDLHYGAYKQKNEATPKKLSFLQSFWS